jgi:hypothetical protein
MTVADRETFLALRRALPAATKPCLRETFGVSETTWVKLRDGLPVKASTLERVLARYRGLCGHAESRAAGGQERGGADARAARTGWPDVACSQSELSSATISAASVKAVLAAGTPA